VPDPQSGTPRAFGLERAVPNPFSRETRVSCAVPRPARVQLAVYDVAGRQVRTLMDAEMQPGNHRVAWDGRDRRGRAVAGGIYYLRMLAPGFERTTRVTILR
jgi:flagellar hook assembly protein FlgD